jgi:hypothetical protein
MRKGRKNIIMIFREKSIAMVDKEVDQIWGKI